jgi:hypothetical protein
MSNYLLINNEMYGVWNEMPDELYVIGDIHGDFFALKQSLELTGCVYFEPYNDEFKKDKYGYYLDDGCKYYSVMNNNVKWKKEKHNCFIVLTGDIIDRCRPNNIYNKDCINTVSDEDCDLLLLKLLFDLDEQASKYGSRLIVILGNHEIMNIQNDLTYISLKARKNKNRDIKQYLNINLSKVYGIIRINKYIMAHGGINNIFFDNFNKNNIIGYESIQMFNSELRKFLLYGNDNNNINSYNSPFWDRTLGGRDYLNKGQCKDIFENNLLQIKDFDKIKTEMKIIVGHCPQFAVNQTINLVDCQEYKNKIYRIDVGMSRAFDLYDMDKILDEKTDLLNMNYKDFFINNIQTQNRAVSCIKLTKTDETIIKGQLTIDYFYNLDIFKSNKLIIQLHIFSDLIKIFIDNYIKNYDPVKSTTYSLYINKLFGYIQKIASELSK